MTRYFWTSAIKRAGHTAAQTAIGGIGTAVLVEEVPWLAVGSMTVLATLLSLLKSVAVGTPEGGEGVI